MRLVKIFWVKHRKTILYHLRSIGDSFATGVLMYLVATWGTISMSVSNWEWATLSGVVFAAARSGWKMASRPILSSLVNLLSYFKKKKK